MTDYRLSLTKDKTSAGLSALWHLDGAATSPLTITAALTPADLAEHRWYLEEYILFPGPGDHARARAFEARLEAFGQDLRRALYLDGVDVLRDLAAADAPRVLTLTSQDPEALSIPWELLRDGKGPLILQDIIVRRALPVQAQVKVKPIPALPLRILLVIARPTDAGQIDARSSAGPMLDALDALGGLVHVESCDPPTLAEMERRLGAAKDRNERFHVVHFDGHGVYLQDLGVGALSFENDDATKHLVLGRDFGDLLARMDVPLAFLEACQTADLSSAPVFGSVAPALLKAGVGSVIAFSHALLVTAARILVASFYVALCKGHSVGATLNEGRRALKADPGRIKTHHGDLTLRDWHIAQLYQAGAVDPSLVPVGATTVAAGTEPLQRGREPGSDFSIEPMYGFHGRAAELLKLQRKLRKHGAVVLQGGGGMGKTSLAREAARWWHKIGLRPGGAAFFSFESRQGADRAVLGFVEYVEGEKFKQGSPEELWARAVRYFREGDVLWVWDNFESTLAQYQKGHDEGSTVFGGEERDRLRKLYGELTKKGSKGWLVVTCRPDNTGLPAIAEMTLGGLSQADALEMAKRVLDKKDIKIGDIGYERESIEELLKAVDCHPLSIELVMAHCKVIKPAEAAKDLRKVIAAASQAAGEDRNTSLVASLKWSTGRLSQETQGVLPYLAWFDGGAFEVILETFCDVGPEVWERVRGELLATALLWRGNVRFANKPYLGFHPTLRYAATSAEVANETQAAKRFVAVYYALSTMADKALRGAEPAGVMRVILREEGNLRRAMALAFAYPEHGVGPEMASTIGLCLFMAGRDRDQARLAKWVHVQMAEATGPAKWAMEREHAWGLCLAGKAEVAVDMLLNQLGEIEQVGGDAPQRAHCHLYCGRILHYAGRSQQALGPLAKAIEGCDATDDRGNLMAALGDQSNALREIGKLAEALASAERVVAIARDRTDARSEAVGLGQIARILMEQHRLGDAEQRYEEALKAACRAGDRGLECVTLQHLGILASKRGHHALAVTCYKEALAHFRAVDDRAGEMRTADLLGSAEDALGHYESAWAWYAYAERLARDIGDDAQIGATARNIGILLQTRALALPDDANEERERLLSQAAASVATSLAIHQKCGDELGAAASRFQLGVIHLKRGSLDDAERDLQEALAFYEPHDLPDVYKVYGNLGLTALARNRPEDAAAWRAKAEAKIAQLARLARGDGAESPPPPAPAPPSHNTCPCGSNKPFLDCHGAPDDDEG